jgi:hypothetical protein
MAGNAFSVSRPGFSQSVCSAAEGDGVVLLASSDYDELKNQSNRFTEIRQTFFARHALTVGPRALRHSTRHTMDRLARQSR